MSAAKVVSSATSADANAPLVVDAKGEPLLDQNGRLIVNLAAVLGVSVAPVTPGVLPVEVTQPAWTKTFAPLGANGDVLIVAAATGRLQRLQVLITAGSGVFVHICGKAALPPTAATLLNTPIPFPAASAASPSFVDEGFDDVGGLDFTNGLVVGLSTTGATYTAPAGAAGVVTAWWL